MMDRGFARLPGANTLMLLEGAASQWADFAQSWDRLGPDLYMADGGRYRRRRHAAFTCEQGRFIRKPHQPHYQSRDYNPLNGDVQRWFDPVEQSTVENGVMPALMKLCARVFDPDRSSRWHVEAHQFRIEAQAGAAGRPTPEGMHRDGVDHVFVMLVERRNVREGVTRIGAPDGAPMGEFTLTQPGDAMFIDDHRIMHGVTEIHPIDQARPAWRDALVITFAAER
nr:2OG-Fe dioxygenase family protein [Sphingobium fontiphilum]